MGFLKSVVKSTMVDGPGYSLGHSISSNGVSNIFGSGGANINVLEEYNGWAWKCVNIRAEELASWNFFIERKVADKWQKDDNHPFGDVLEGEEGTFDLSEILEAHQTLMDMYGESFWYFSKVIGRSQPYAVYLLDPAHVTVYVSDERVTGYIYQKDGNSVTLDLDEVAHFRASYNPKTPFRGVGPMQKAGWFIKSSRYVTTYVNNFLENNGIPAGVIVAKEGFTDDADWKLFKQQWSAKYSGIDNAGKTGFVRSASLDFVKTGLSLGEVDFEKVKSSSRDDILAMFSVPKSRLGLYEDMNKASSVTSDLQFAKSFTKGAVKRITRRITKKVGNWYGPEYRFASDFSLPEDRELKLKEYKEGVGRWFTANEAREAYGKEPIDGGEVLDNTKAPVSPAQNSKKKLLVRLKSGTPHKAIFSYEMKESFRVQMEELQVKFEQSVLQAMHPVLTDQRDRVIDQLNPKKMVEANFDADAESKKMADELLGVFISLADDAGAAAIQFAVNADATFNLTPAIKQYIEESLRKSTQSFTEETQQKIAAAVTDGLQAGESIADITKKVKAIYSEIIPPKNGKGSNDGENAWWRAERLSRTEVIKTSNEIAEAAYKQSGVVIKKEWFKNPGACEFCQKLSGNVASLGSVFVPKGSTIEGVDGGSRVNSYEDIAHPPVHPACRCTIIPVVE